MARVCGTAARARATRGLLRTLRPPSGIDLSSNDYLGLATHPRVTERMIDGGRARGRGQHWLAAAARRARGFARDRARFARFKGTERSLYFSSGYLANLAVLTTFAEAGDVILSDERNHASLIDGIRLSRGAARHLRAQRRRPSLRARCSTDARRRRASAFVVVESLFSMDGDEAPLDEYAELCEATGAHLIVDEAHAVGVYGARGSGLIEEHGVERRRVPVGEHGGQGARRQRRVRRRAGLGDRLPDPARAAVHLLDGAAAGRCRRARREPRHRRARTGAPRALLDACAQRCATRLHDGRHSGPAPGASHIVPVLIGDNDRAVAVAEALQAEGFDVRAIRPPTVPPGTARLRISVNVNLTDDDDRSIRRRSRSPAVAGAEVRSRDPHGCSAGSS